MTKPTVGRIVHYVSYGTPKGEYTSQCRAAMVTEAGMDEKMVSLCILNPTGMFFTQDLFQDEENKKGGTWHWPEREE